MTSSFVLMEPSSLSTRTTESEERTFLPSISSRRSLADSAYFGNDCLVAVKRYDVTPLNSIKKNAGRFPRP
jgi:hypothetical protein